MLNTFTASFIIVTTSHFSTRLFYVLCTFIFRIKDVHFLIKYYMIYLYIIYGTIQTNSFLSQNGHSNIPKTTKLQYITFR